ncbi:endosome-associated-trafficking regulator 1 isoform X1 [Camarhynchus parvulus]|uniref:endosome-associated-trafficking regulator 1 isoform X1 n=1 Tax=Geospiza parvula TaxID=87175 RepID=UPI001237DF07|nr:endosome-associated-trafficking regulator 1 isoform X1 [Camarhynchus parvulus]
MAAPALPVAEPLPGAPAEPNPFSFREFVRSKARGGGGAGADTQAAWAVPPLPAVPAESGDEQEDEEEEWSESYRPLAVEQEHLGSAGAAPEPGWVPPLQPSYEQLKEENAILRSKINKLQILSETQADKMRKLEKKLEENKIKEEKEAQDLEAMVQHVEQNLQLMTKRAAKAENSAAKLRQENAQLQAELRNSRLEKEELRAGQAGLAAAKQNAEAALQQLLQVTASSRASIRSAALGQPSHTLLGSQTNLLTAFLGLKFRGLCSVPEELLCVLTRDVFPSSVNISGKWELPVLIKCCLINHRMWGNSPKAAWLPVPTCNPASLPLQAAAVWSRIPAARG